MENTANRERFLVAFQISKLVLFEVHYYILGDNSHPYFSTTAKKFVPSKRDFSCAGQCQEDLLPKNSSARRFFDKWDKFHLQDLSDEDYQQLIADVEALKTHYNYVYISQSKQPRYDSIPFYQLVELSKMQPKHTVSLQ